QVLRGGCEACVVDVVGDDVVDGGQGAAEFGGCGRLVAGGHEGSEDAVVDLVVEDGDADAFGGEGVGVGVGDALDEAVEAEATQVVGHLGSGVVLPEQS